MCLRRTLWSRSTTDNTANVATIRMGNAQGSNTIRRSADNANAERRRRVRNLRGTNSIEFSEYNEVLITTSRQKSLNGPNYGRACNKLLMSYGKKYLYI